MTVVWFGSKRLNDSFRVADIQRPLPEFVSTTVKVDGDDGERFDGLTLGKREVTLSLMVRNKTRRQIQDAARVLMGIIGVTTPRELVISDERDPDGFQLTRYAVPVGVTQAEEVPGACRWTVTFEQADPYLYGKSRSAVVKANTWQTVDTGGNAKTYPNITSKPTGNFYQFRTQLDTFAFSAPFAGAEIRVDCENMKVNVVPSRTDVAGLYSYATFPVLEGTMRMQASHLTTVTWKERWL